MKGETVNESVLIHITTSQITRVFAFYVSLSNLVNVLQRNLRTNKVRECISRVFGGTHLEKLAPHKPWW